MGVTKIPVQVSPHGFQVHQQPLQPVRCGVGADGLLSHLSGYLRNAARQPAVLTIVSDPLGHP